MPDHTFITEQELFHYIMAYGWAFPLVIVAAFFALYRYGSIKRLKELIKRNKNLLNLEGRSNGHHKPKEKVNG